MFQGLVYGPHVNTKTDTMSYRATIRGAITLKSYSIKRHCKTETMNATAFSIVVIRIN